MVKTFKQAMFKAAILLLISSSASAAISMFQTAEREEVFAFTHTLLPTPLTIFVHSDETEIKDNYDLSGKTVVLMSAVYAKQILEERGIECKVVFGKTMKDTIKLLSRKQLLPIIHQYCT